jgi:uncharacterized membrane protein
MIPLNCRMETKLTNVFFSLKLDFMEWSLNSAITISYCIAINVDNMTEFSLQTQYLVENSKCSGWDIASYITN